MEATGKRFSEFGQVAEPIRCEHKLAGRCTLAEAVLGRCAEDTLPLHQGVDAQATACRKCRAGGSRTLAQPGPVVVSLASAAARRRPELGVDLDRLHREYGDQLEQVDPPPDRPADQPATGPGGVLLEMYAARGYQACSRCRDLAARMDRWGPAGCLERIERIVEDILPRARKRAEHELAAVAEKWRRTSRALGPLAKTRLAGRVAAGILRAQIRRDIRRAVRIAGRRNGSDQRTRSP